MVKLNRFCVVLPWLALLGWGDLSANCMNTAPETSYNLIAEGSSAAAGTVDVTAQTNTLRIRYTLNKGWLFAGNDKAQLWAGQSITGIPTSEDKDTPAFEKFPYISADIGTTNIYQFVIPLSGRDANKALYVFVHANLKKENADNKVYSSWAGNFKKGNGAYFKVDLMNQCVPGNDMQKQLMKENPAITYVPSPS